MFRSSCGLRRMCQCNGNRQIAVDIRQDICADESRSSGFNHKYSRNDCRSNYWACRSGVFQILVHLILNLAILPTVGILFGAVLACGAKRGAAYIIIAVVTLLSTPLAGGWCVTIYKATGFSASVLTRLFPFMTPSIMLASLDLAYGYSLRPYRIFAYAVWILVLCAVLFFYISKERGKRNGCSRL